MHNSVGKLSRRKLLKAGAALGLSALPAAGGLPLFNVRRSFAQDAADPAEVLNKINVGGYVKKEYRDLYKLKDDDLLWDPKKDWIRNVDWEQVRKEFAGKTVKFAIGAADAESAADGLKPFEALEVMLATTDLRHEVLSDGTILIK